MADSWGDNHCKCLCGRLFYDAALQGYAPRKHSTWRNHDETFQSNCAPCIPGKIWKYVVENFNFVSDDPFDERIAAPYLMNEIRQGDCDDFALFIKTCMDILGGWHTAYILFGRERRKYTHIAVFVHRGIIGNKYIDPIIIDGANPNFNIIPTTYKFYKTV